MRKKLSKPDSLHAERTAKEHWLAEKHRLEVEQMKGNLVDVETFAKRWDGVFIKLKAIVQGSKMSEEEKFNCLDQLSKVLTGDAK